jgi:hypothetical protein
MRLYCPRCSKFGLFWYSKCKRCNFMYYGDDNYFFDIDQYRIDCTYMGTKIYILTGSGVGQTVFIKRILHPKTTIQELNKILILL